MPEKDLFFNFMDGLQNWAELELQRRGVQDLATAMAVAEQLVEFKKMESSKSGHSQDGGEKRYSHKEESHKPSEGKGGKEEKRGGKGFKVQSKFTRDPE